MYNENNASSINNLSDLLIQLKEMNERINKEAKELLKQAEMYKQSEITKQDNDKYERYKEYLERQEEIEKRELASLQEKIEKIKMDLLQIENGYVEHTQDIQNEVVIAR